MAYGIEEIAEMQVTGPVKGGDMVMKPDQAPVGAAALLNKMQKKNTPGIFKLPEADKEMPAFMKIAAEGVEEQNTANLENQEIMRIMGQYGVGPDEAKRIYDEMIYGYERDEAAVAPNDWRTILKMIESGMSQEEIDAQMAAVKFPGNFTSKDQNVTELPRNLKTAPDHPETELAYITDDEKALLAFMKPGTPHEGPEGIPTYDEGDYLADIGYSKPQVDKYTTSTQQGGYIPQASQQQQQDFAEYVAQVGTGGHQSAYEQEGHADQAAIDEVRAGDRKVEDRTTQEYRDKMGMTADTINPYGFNFDVVPDWRKNVFPGGTGDPTVMTDTDYNKNLDFLNKQIAELQGKEELSKDENKRLIELYDRRLNVQGGKTGQGESRLDEDFYKDEKDEKDEENDFEKFIKNILGGKTIRELDATGKKVDIMKLLDDFERFKGGPLESRKKMLEDLAKGKGNYYRRDKDGNLTNDLTLEGLKKALRSIDMGPNSASALESLKKYDPARYYEAMGMPQTTGELENLSKTKTKDLSQFERGTDEYDKAAAFNEQIFQARETVSRGKDDNSGQKGSGVPAEQVTETETEVTENITPDERAGSWNLGGTMPYSDDLYTQGTEIDVPLGRRFEIDKDKRYLTSNKTKDDMYKYATEGGYSQLEPFQNYLARRRKHLGEQPDEWFDEEGNVIYSSNETV